jgi:hypothetical protein
VSLLAWNLTLDLSGLGDPASSYATASIALEIIGARKPHRHDKAKTPPGEYLPYKNVLNVPDLTEVHILFQVIIFARNQFFRKFI